jgi:hypothetical protein
MFNRAQPMSRNAQAYAFAKRFGEQSHILQIGQECALCLVVGMGHIVSYLATLAGQLANARHINRPEFDSGYSGKPAPLMVRTAFVNTGRTLWHRK